MGGRRQSRVRCWKPILGGGNDWMRGKFCGVGSDATSLAVAMTGKGWQGRRLSRVYGNKSFTFVISYYQQNGIRFSAVFS